MTGVLLQSGLTATNPLQLGAQLLGIGIAAATAAGLVAVSYRWYARERVPTGLGVLFGLSTVAVYLGTTGALGAVISGQEQVLATDEVLPNLAAFALGAIGSSVGIRGGDAVGTDLFAATGGRDVDADVSDIVQTVGRVTSVRMPDEIDDIVGYDPMPDATKTTLASRRFLFPRRLTKGELRDRLVSRLKTDYGVGHVDVEFDDDGTITYLAIGSRAAGIGPTLPPATNAVAIHADPANAASSGDLVQVWETDPFQRVLTGELRGIAGDVVTVAIDAADTPKLDPSGRYKLVTLPVQDRPDREFASLLRAAEETMGTVTVGPNSPLVGMTVEALGVTVVAITPEDAPVETLPSRERTLQAGDVVSLIAKPEAIRHAEADASATTAGSESVVEDEPTVSDAEDDPIGEDDAGDERVDSNDSTGTDEPTIPDAEDDETERDADLLDGDEPVTVWDPEDRLGDELDDETPEEWSLDETPGETDDDAAATDLFEGTASSTEETDETDQQ